MKFVSLIFAFILAFSVSAQKSVSYDIATKDVYPTGLNLSGGSTTNTVFEGVLAPITAYGAVGDGATDNAAAIEAALATGYPIFVPTGVFKVSSEVDVPTGARIYGNSGGIIQAGSTGISVLKLFAVNDIIIQGVQFRGASNNAAASSAAGNAIYITQGSYDVKILEIDARYFNSAVFANTGSSNIFVNGCTFVGNARTAVNTDTAYGGSISDNYIDGTRTGVGDGLLQQVGIWLQKDSLYWTVGNNIINNLRAEAINVKGRHSSIIGNTINTVDNGIIFETDSADVTESNHGSFNNAVGNSITNVTGVGIFGGNTIGVNNAVVHNLVISGNTISGAEYGMSFAGLNSSATNERPYAITVVGNTVNATTVGVALGINANDSVFSGNILRGAFTDAIQLYRGTNNIISGNEIYGPANNGIYLFTGGLNNSVRGNTVIGGAASAANTYDGIRISAQTNAVISDNFVYGADWRYLLNDENTAVGSTWKHNTPSGSYGTSPFNFAGTTSTRFNNYSGVIAVDDVNQRFGIGTQNPSSTWGGNRAALDFRARYMLVGSDLTADFQRTDDTAKRFGIAVSPYNLTPAVDVTAFQWDMGSANNVQSYGGGTSANYAMTRHSFFAAANTSTATGTEVVRVINGGMSVGTAADPAATLDVGGSVVIAASAGYAVRDSGGSAKTAISRTDGSGVILGNGVDAVRVIAGSDGIQLGQSGTTSPVTIPRKNSADATTNLVDSNQLRIGANIWNGSSGTDYFMRLANFAVATNGPAYYLGFTDNDGNLLLSLTNSTGNAVLLGSFKATGGITNTTVSGNTVSAGSGTLSLGTNTVVFSQPFTANGSAENQGIRFDGSSWGASSLFVMMDTANTTALSYSGTNVTLIATNRAVFNRTLTLTNNCLLTITASDGSMGGITLKPDASTPYTVYLDTGIRCQGVAAGGSFVVTNSATETVYLAWQATLRGASSAVLATKGYFP